LGGGIGASNLFDLIQLKREIIKDGCKLKDTELNIEQSKLFNDNVIKGGVALLLSQKRKLGSNQITWDIVKKVRRN